MVRKTIENFIEGKPSYLKESPRTTLEAIYKQLPSNIAKNSKDFEKHIELVREIQSELRRKSKNKTLTEVLEEFDKDLEKKEQEKKILFFDIEVSPNIVMSWRIGGDISISPDDILQERAIICICYKWADQKYPKSLQWENGDDKKLVEEFAKIIDSADVVVGQNGDAFDIKWLRTRCLYHGVQVSKKFNSIDTLKWAKSQFKFNSNKLDYMGEFLGIGKKMKTDYSLWKNITLKNCKKSMDYMIEYCKQDVLLLEKLYNKLKSYCPEKRIIKVKGSI